MQKKARLAWCELMKTEGVHHANVDLEDWENLLCVEFDGNFHAKQVENNGVLISGSSVMTMEVNLY